MSKGFSLRLRRKEKHDRKSWELFFPRTVLDKDSFTYLQTSPYPYSVGSGLCFQIPQGHFLGKLSQKILFLLFFLTFFMIAQIEYLLCLVSVMLAF